MSLINILIKLCLLAVLRDILLRMKRRELLQQMAVAGTILAPPMAPANTSDRLGPVLPQRTLGKCGEKVTCIGLGGFHVGMPPDEATAQAIIEKALETGIRFFDNAQGYHKGLSEERFGRYLIPRYRDDIFLMTKTQAKDAATARLHLEDSLRRMKTDVIDLWQIHSLRSPEDADDRLAKGVFEEVLKAQQEGKVRHLGFTGHASPYAHIRMAEQKEISEACTACQHPVNPVDMAARHSFTEQAMPALLEKNIGILAMKTLADGRFFSKKTVKEKVRWTSDNPVIPNTLTVEECITFALSLPVSVLITGCENTDYVEEKAAIARRFSTLTAEQRMALVERVAAFAEEGKVEYYKNKDIRAGTRKS
jgi:aryl-alcohol dehydrogenase-like predicted oxidoreductase